MKEMKFLIRLTILGLILMWSCKHSQSVDIVDHLHINSNSFIAFTGDEQIDSLIQAKADMPLDTNFVLYYCTIAESFEDYDFDRAATCYLKMNELIEQLDWDKGRYIFAIGYAHVLIRQNMIDSAIKVNLKGLELAKKKKNDYYTGKLAYSTGNAYLVKEWFTIALGYYLEALADFEERNDEERLMSVYSQLCCLYSNIDMGEKAIDFGKKAIAIYPDDPYVLNNLAKAYFINQDINKGVLYLEKALQISIQQHNPFLIGMIYYQLSENYLINFNLDKAEQYAKESIKINKDICHEAAYAGVLAILSKVEQLKGNFEQSEIYVNEALELVTKENNLQGQRYCFVILSELAILKHKYSENNYYWSKLYNVNTKIANENQHRIAEEMNVKYENEKKENEIEKQKIIINNNKYEQNALLMILGLFFLLFIMLIILLRSHRHKNSILEEMNATKDKFFSIISHDLKNPTITQQKTLQILVENVHNMDMDSLNESLNMLLENTDRLVTLLYDLLQWAQLQTGRLQCKLTTYNLSVALRSDVMIIDKMAKLKGITFNVNVPEKFIVIGDISMINTVVRNLLSNAVKFTPESGTVSLDIYPHKDVSRCKCIIAVTDSGVGISSYKKITLNNMKKIQSKLGTFGEQGSGLGLIICNEFLEKNGSKLHIESKVGKGSRFWFELEYNKC